MSVRRIKNHGTWVWQARVAYRGLRKAAFRSSKEAARDAEAELLRELKAQAGQAEQEGLRPVTVKALFEFYVGTWRHGARGRTRSAGRRSLRRPWSGSCRPCSPRRSAACAIATSTTSARRSPVRARR
jgi:hypothetical protein